MLFESEDAHEGADRCSSPRPHRVLLPGGPAAAASDRRRPVARSPTNRLRAALGVSLAMALVLIGFNLGRGFYLDAIENAGRSTDAGAAAFDQVLMFLRLSLRTIFVLGLVVAFGLWVAGPGRLATRVRTGVAGLVRGDGTGESTAVGRFAASLPHRAAAGRRGDRHRHPRRPRPAPAPFGVDRRRPRRARAAADRVPGAQRCPLRLRRPHRPQLVAPTRSSGRGRSDSPNCWGRTACVGCGRHEKQGGEA